MLVIMNQRLITVLIHLAYTSACILVPIISYLEGVCNSHDYSLPRKKLNCYWFVFWFQALKWNHSLCEAFLYTPRSSSVPGF